MPDQIGRLDLMWIRTFLTRCVVHGTDQDELFRVVTKIDKLLERKNQNGTVRESEPRTAA